MDSEDSIADLHPIFYHPNNICNHPSSGAECHSHILEYVSSANPAEPEVFSSLRRATVRTLSGEQLPRGHTSGPLWFGDSITGYTIAYIFRLEDEFARGGCRYYALLALAGSDTQRAFEACTLVWSLFEEIVTHIVQMASGVKVHDMFDRDSAERSYITRPSSVLTTGRMSDSDGLIRRGPTRFRPNGLAELLNNDNFFCELHMIFTRMLQSLGKILGGMRIQPLAEIPCCRKKNDVQPGQQSTLQNKDTCEKNVEEAEIFPINPLQGQAKRSESRQPSRGISAVSLCSSLLITPRHQVAV